MSISQIKDGAVRSEFLRMQREMRKLEGNVSRSAVNRTVVNTAASGSAGALFIQETEPPYTEGAWWLKQGPPSILRHGMGGDWHWVAETE